MKNRRKNETGGAVASLSAETQGKLEQALRVWGDDGDAAIGRALDELLAARRKSELQASSRGLSPHHQLLPRHAMPREGSALPVDAFCQSTWEELPYTVAECLYEKVVVTASVRVRPRLLLVCQSWRRQFGEFVVDAVPHGLCIANRRCNWKLCNDGEVEQDCSTPLAMAAVRALSVGVRKLPSPRLVQLPAALPRLQRLDLHFPPTFNFTAPEHLEHLQPVARAVPSLGLQFRSFGTPHSQVMSLRQLPSLHRLSYKIHRCQSQQSVLREHARVLQSLTQLRELSLRVSFEGFLPARFGCLSILASIPALTSLTIRTRHEFGNWIELPKLGGLSMLTSLKRLDIDGLTELRPGDALLLSELVRLETLILRNSAYLGISHLASLTRLTCLRRLDFSLHGEYVGASMYRGLEEEPPAGEQESAPCELVCMTSLTDLDLANRLDFDFQRDIASLLRMTSLIKLNLCQALSTAPFHESLTALVSLQQLQALNLEGYTDDLTCITQFQRLHHLCLRSCHMVDSELLDELATYLPGLTILDIADCAPTSASSVLDMLKRLPVLWAFGMPGHALSIDVVAQLHAMTGLHHLYIDRMSQATLAGVTCRPYAGRGQSRNGITNLVRRYLVTELPGKLREYTMFYRNGYIDFPDWDSWWLTDVDEDLLSDREYSESDSSRLGSDGGYSEESDDGDEEDVLMDVMGNDLEEWG